MVEELKESFEEFQKDSFIIGECPICFEYYNAHHRVPKGLPCFPSHIVCLQCLLQLCKNESSSQCQSYRKRLIIACEQKPHITCPMCRMVFHPADGNIETLPTVTNLEDLEKNIQLGVYRVLEKLDSLLTQLKARKEDTIAAFKQILSEIKEHHKNCTVSRLVGSSVGIAGATMSLVGLALAPFTFGISLGLVAVGSVTGVAGGATAAGTSIVEMIINDVKIKEVSGLLETCRKLQDKIKNCCEQMDINLQMTNHIFNSNNLCKPSFSSSTSVSSREQYLTTGARLTVNVAGATLAGTAAKVSSMTAARIAGRVAGAAFSLVTIPIDIASIVVNSIELHKKNPTELEKQLTIRLGEIETQLESFIKDTEQFIQGNL